MPVEPRPGSGCTDVPLPAYMANTRVVREIKEQTQLLVDVARLLALATPTDRENDPATRVQMFNRSNEADGVGDFDFGRDWRSLRATPADNLLAVKLSYWLGL